MVETFLVALRLGLTSFGGPVAHLGYFHAEYVERRRWLDSATYAEVVAMAQALPGPASSQVGIAVGMLRARWPGAFAAWLGFTAPSAALMIAFAFGLEAAGDVEGRAWLRGLRLAALPVVATAVWTMARSLTPDPPRAAMALAAAAAVLMIESAGVQVLVITGAGLAGWALFRGGVASSSPGRTPARGFGGAIAALAAFFALLAGLPFLAAVTSSHAVYLFDAFFRAGSLVFGGGHVVLPLLERAVVPPGWVSQDQFLAGYGAAQALPGPLFTFSAFLGAAEGPAPRGVSGGLLCLFAVFLPSFLLIGAGLPLWSVLRGKPWFQAAIRGANAGVVGLLLAALYDPIWTHAVGGIEDFALALAGLMLLAGARAPPWSVVVLTAAGAEVLAAL